MGSQPQLAKPEDAKERIARRVAQEMRDGYCATLGVGIPVMVANYIPEGIEVVLEAENGMLGIGPYPFEDQVDPDLVNAGKSPSPRFPERAISTARTRSP
jgi:3-oxoacid CoA-transferase B subunit